MMDNIKTPNEENKNEKERNRDYFVTADPKYAFRVRASACMEGSNLYRTQYLYGMRRNRGQSNRTYLDRGNMYRP